MRANQLLSYSLLFTLFLFSCGKEEEQFQTERPSDYVALQKGQYITYRLDSTVFTQQGRRDETHSYQEKHIVDSVRNDNLNRPSYRVFRYIRDTAGAQPWRPSGTYWITPTENTLEVIENNLRSIRLILPVKADETWKGNRFFGTDPYATLYGTEFNNDNDMFNWDFTYEAIDDSRTFNGQTVNNIITVKHVDESTNVPITNPNTYASINYSEDQYAKGIGLVYQNLIMWEYQVVPGGPSPYKVGFGVKRSMIDHN